MKLTKNTHTQTHRVELSVAFVEFGGEQGLDLLNVYPRRLLIGSLSQSELGAELIPLVVHGATQDDD